MGVAGVGALLAIPSIANCITYLFTADYLCRRAVQVVLFAIQGSGLLQESGSVLGFIPAASAGAVATQNKVIEETKDFSYLHG